MSPEQELCFRLPVEALDVARGEVQRFVTVPSAAAVILERQMSGGPIGQQCRRHGIQLRRPFSQPHVSQSFRV